MIAIRHLVNGFKELFINAVFGTIAVIAGLLIVTAPFFAMVWIARSPVRNAIGYHPIVELVLLIFGLVFGGMLLVSAYQYVMDYDPPEDDTNG